MIVLFLIAAFFDSYGVSLPIVDVTDPLQQLQSCPVNVIVPNHKMRTMSDIVWSCVSTLFICMWVAIHPNIPPQEGPIRSLWRRIKIMLWTLLVPELMLIWAYRQWASARYIAEYFKDENWTLMHGHFLIMGGFVYVDGERESVLEFYDFRHLLGLEIVTESGYTIGSRLVGRISFPTITDREICDKARGDFLSKAIVILQSLWFIVQCIARYKEGLALTELELVTLAVASLTGVMYFFWWDKPLGVKEPIKLYRKGKEPAEVVIEGGSSEHNRRAQRIKDSKRSLVQNLNNLSLVCPLKQLQSSLLQFLKDSHTSLASYYDRLSSISSSSVNQFLKNQRNKLHERTPAVNYLWLLYLPLYWFIWIPSKSLWDALNTVANTYLLNPRESRVPTFYAPRISHSIDGETLIFFVLPPIAVIFGVLHCLAWNFHFPTHIEQLFWRIGSLAITLIPSLPVLFIAPLIKFMKFGDSRSSPLSFSMQQTLEYSIWFLGGVGLVAYVLARVLLLILAIVLLRKQPDSAFFAIDWLNFLPHI